MSNNSDYDLPRLNLFDLLPSVYQSNVNRSLLENLQNRFLTKKELVKVVGMIGRKLPSDVDINIIPESTDHRQAWQLQPAIYQKIATVNHIASYYDILQQAGRLGVDRERLPEWGNTRQFNFVPPVDLDKVVNFVNYYWYDPLNPNSTPQYITVQNQCTKSQAILNAVIEDVGGTLVHQIFAVNTATGDFKILNNFETAFPVGSTFNVEQSDNNDGSYTVVSAIYDGENTLIRVTAPISDTGILGRITLEERFGEFFAARDCACYGQVGWDVKLWDDNDSTNTTVPPTGVPIPEGTHNWEQSDDCNIQTDVWSPENKWTHIIDIPNTSIAKRAEMPILEYLPNLEFNEWSKTTYRWKYRAQTNVPWVEVDSEPTSVEMAGGFDITAAVDEQANPRLPGNPLNGVVILAGDRRADFVGSTRATLIGPAGETENHTISIVWPPPINTNVTSTEVWFEDAISTSVDPTWKLYPSDKTSRGDAWLGFLAQWLFIGIKEVAPITNQLPSPTIVTEDYSIPVTATGPGLTTFLFATYTTNAIIGADDIRVYVNNQRQYVTYEEIPGIPLPSGNGFYVAGIQFFPAAARVPFDNIRVEVSAAGVEDNGNEQVPVRTVEDNTEYETLVLSGMQPALQSVVRYRKVEQTKQPGETKYPVFNIYNVDQSFRGVSPIFKFLESDSAALEPLLGGKRIVITDFGKNYSFEQELVDTNTGVMYTYRDLNTISSENPEGFQTIWRGGYGNDEFYTPRKVTADRLPIQELDIFLANGTTEIFTIDKIHGDQTKLLAPNSSFEVSNSTTDNGVYTVKESSYDGIYTQITVNENINNSTLGDGALTSLTSADWEIPNQLYYNASHENRRVVTFSELFTHFNTIIENQEPPANIIKYSPTLWRILNNPNYGGGGTIKEHNDSYDTFLSSLFVNSSNPLQIIEFAQTRYETNLNSIGEGFKQGLFTQLTTIDDPHFVNLGRTIANDTITLFEQNDINSTTFGDSNTYNSDTNEGIRGHTIRSTSTKRESNVPY